MGSECFSNLDSDHQLIKDEYMEENFLQFYKSKGKSINASISAPCVLRLAMRQAASAAPASPLMRTLANLMLDR